MIYYNNYFVGEVEFALKVVSKEKNSSHSGKVPSKAGLKPLGGKVQNLTAVFSSNSTVGFRASRDDCRIFSF